MFLGEIDNSSIGHAQFFRQLPNEEKAYTWILVHQFIDDVRRNEGNGASFKRHSRRLVVFFCEVGPEAEELCGLDDPDDLIAAADSVFEQAGLKA